MKTEEFARGKWLEIFEFYGLPHVKSNSHTTCPLCGRKEFRIDDKNGSGSWICVCGHGFGFNLLIEATGKSFKELAAEIDIEFGNVQSGPVKPQPPSKKQMSLDKFNSIYDIQGTDVDDYLVSRGIKSLPTFSVRFNPKEYDRELNKYFESMYCIATDDFNNIIYAHKTYLENAKKANVERNKKIELMSNSNKVTCGECGSENAQSAAIRLCNYSEELGISEGVETALSVTDLYGIGCWSVINTAIMKVFKAPPGVKNLKIYADNDYHGAGLAAAFVCGNKNIMANNDVEMVTIIWCDDKGVDFNDLANNPHLTTSEFILTKKGLQPI